MFSHSIYQVFHRVLGARPTHTYSVAFRPQGEDERIPTKVLWTLFQTRHTGLRIEQLDPGLEFHLGSTWATEEPLRLLNRLEHLLGVVLPLGRMFCLA